MSRPAVFLDRDGVLVEEIFYPQTGEWEAPLRPEDVRLLPGVAAAARDLAVAGYALVLVSNQAAYAKGRSSLRELWLAYERFIALLLAEDVRLDGVFYAYGHPEGIVPHFSGASLDRKPGPYNVFVAAAQLDLDLTRSWMIGDRETDLLCARAAGVRAILVENLHVKPPATTRPSSRRILRMRFDRLANLAPPAPRQQPKAETITRQTAADSIRTARDCCREGISARVSGASSEPERVEMAWGSRLEIADSVQRLAPPSNAERFEGISFSSSGNTIAVATADTNAVLLFRRKMDGLFEDAPYWRIGGPGLHYPHDVSFSTYGDSELLAVAQRRGAIAIYEKNRASENFSLEPAREISGSKSRLAVSDGVAFVPPNNEYLAACNLELGSISFFRRVSRSATSFEDTPDFELKHPSIYRPDGLAFSRRGKWLAIANHGNNSVVVFQRRNKFLSGGKLAYGPEPITIIEDPQLRYPHSVAFTPRTNHLIVTNAGANYFSAYEPRRHYFETRWSQSPILQKAVGSEETFREVNSANKMEGGPKGIAIHNNNLAVCSPEFGVKIYSFREVF